MVELNLDVDDAQDRGDPRVEVTTSTVDALRKAYEEITRLREIALALTNNEVTTAKRLAQEWRARRDVVLNGEQQLDDQQARHPRKPF